MNSGVVSDAMATVREVDAIDDAGLGTRVTALQGVPKKDILNLFEAT